MKPAIISDYRRFVSKSKVAKFQLSRRGLFVPVSTRTKPIISYDRLSYFIFPKNNTS
jgi:hypothetical protein